MKKPEPDLPVVAQTHELYDPEILSLFGNQINVLKIHLKNECRLNT